MIDKDVLIAVKAAAALHSPVAGIGDIADDSTFDQLGIVPAVFSAFRADLHRLLTTATEQPMALPEFSQRLALNGKLTMAKTAEVAAPLVHPLIVCDALDPGDNPDQPTCTIWMFRSFLCRVNGAVLRWAEPGAVPNDGITPDRRLGQLVPAFDTLSRLKLIVAVNEERVFQPYLVVASDPSAARVDENTTVLGFAKVLWDRNPTPCSILIDFPTDA